MIVVILVNNTVHSFRRGSGFTNASRGSSGWDFGDFNSSPNGSKRVTMRPDLTLEEQRDWEEREMEKPVNFRNFDCLQFVVEIIRNKTN